MAIRLFTGSSRRGSTSDRFAEFERAERQRAIDAVHAAQARLDYADADMVEVAVLELKLAETRLRKIVRGERYRDDAKVEGMRLKLAMVSYDPQKDNYESCDTCGRQLNQMRGEDFYDEESGHVYCERHWPNRGETA